MKKKHRECCPTCERAFKSAFDYPRIRVIAFERLPLPEAVDTMSDEAAQKQLERRRSETEIVLDDWYVGINRTPEIERACGLPEMRNYLEGLSALVGQEVPTDRLKPSLKADGRFRWAYRIPEARLYLSVGESEEHQETGLAADVLIHCDGPNMGSAGGPTLQCLGAIARIRYEGLVNSLPPA